MIWAPSSPSPCERGARDAPSSTPASVREHRVARRGRVGLGRGDVPRGLHAAVLDVPDESRGSPGGARRQHRLLAFDQQPVNRGGSPWFDHLVLIPAYEWPIVILGIVGIVVVLAAAELTGAFLVWMFVGSLAVYSWASERMPWLVLHPLLPLVLLAGIGAQALWTSRARLSARLAIAVVAHFRWGRSTRRSRCRTSGLRTRVSYSCRCRAPTTSPRSGTSSSGSRTCDPRDRRAGRVPGRQLGWNGLAMVVVPAGSATRLLRHVQVRRCPAGTVILVADPNNGAMATRYAANDQRKFRLRVWWAPEWGAASPGDWLRWAVIPEPWSPTATMDQWLYVRPDVAGLAGGGGGTRANEKAPGE